jgi:HK97 family phage major capsid protein
MHFRVTWWIRKSPAAAITPHKIWGIKVKTIKELLEARAQLIKQARELHEKVDGEKRSMNSEEKEQFDKLMSDASDLYDEAERRKKLQLAEDSLEKNFDDGVSGGADPEGRSSDEEKERRNAAWDRFLRHGPAGLQGQEVEFRAIQADDNVGGGFLVAPEQFVSRLIQDIDDMLFIEQKATKFQVPNAESLGVPTLDDDLSDTDWTGEISTVNEDSGLGFGKRQLRPHPMAKLTKVSRTLLRKSILPIQQIVSERMAYRMRRPRENAFLNGSGVNQPLGVFTASDDGIGTSRDVSTGNTTTAPTFDGLIECKFGLKHEYWPMASWLFHPDCLKILVKIKNSDGDYIWRESVSAGEPDTLLGMPVDLSRLTPNTFSTGQYVGLLAVWQYYWIADALDMSVQVLNELYAPTNQVGYIARLESDGMPVKAEAFSRVKLA